MNDNIIKEILEFVYENIRNKGYWLYRSQIKEIVSISFHERIHEFIYEKFGLKSESSLELCSKYIDGMLAFACHGKCRWYPPLSYNPLKFYPKIVFIEFIQTIYDLFYEIVIFFVDFRFSLKGLKRFFQNSFAAVKEFLKTLIQFKV